MNPRHPDPVPRQPHWPPARPVLEPNGCSAGNTVDIASPARKLSVQRGQGRASPAAESIPRPGAGRAQAQADDLAIGPALGAISARMVHPDRPGLRRAGYRLHGRRERRPPDARYPPAPSPHGWTARTTVPTSSNPSVTQFGLAGTGDTGFWCSQGPAEDKKGGPGTPREPAPAVASGAWRPTPVLCTLSTILSGRRSRGIIPAASRRPGFDLGGTSLLRRIALKLGLPHGAFLASSRAPKRPCWMSSSTCLHPRLGPPPLVRQDARGRLT